MRESKSGPAAPAGVVVVVLTYGFRKHHLEKVLTALEASDVLPDEVIVVDNGQVSPIDRTLARKFPIRWVDLPKNLGSAGGYRIGLLEAAMTEYDIWLLDDDNAPAPDCLRNLQNSRQKLGLQSIVLAHRPDRPEFREMVKRGGSRPLRRNSFMAFHWRGTPAGHHLGTTPREGCLPLAYFGYGGALIPSQAGRSGILPEPALFVYHDDSDWSHRLLEAGYTAWLVPQAHIVDLEASWGGQETAGTSPLFSYRTEKMRVWYAIRNRAWVERRLGFGGPEWFLNAALWIVLQGLRACWRERRPIQAGTRVWLATRAFFAGFSGKMEPLPERLAPTSLKPSL